jgi:signal transduction histidine kinase
MHLSDTVQELNEATDEVREIAQGIHPAILTQGGLAPALRTLALRASMPVDVSVEREERLPEPAEVAAYYVTAEALTNAAKHASPSRAWVNLEREDGLVRLRVGDNGVGGADPSTGSGLTGIRDRVEALGGSLSVRSPPGHGTELDVALPVPPASDLPAASG